MDGVGPPIGIVSSHPSCARTNSLVNSALQKEQHKQTVKKDKLVMHSKQGEDNEIQTNRENNKYL